MAGSAADTLTEGIHDLRDYAGETAAQARDAGADIAERARTTFLDAIEREPLVIGALGVAVGAAIGAMIPTSRTEQDYLGAVGARAKESAEAVLAGGIDKAKHVAADVYSAARDEADRQGLVQGEKPLTERVADVAKAAGHELKSSTDDTLHEIEEQADAATERLAPDRD